MWDVQGGETLNTKDGGNGRTAALCLEAWSCVKCRLAKQSVRSGQAWSPPGTIFCRRTSCSSGGWVTSPPGTGIVGGLQAASADSLNQRPEGGRQSSHQGSSATEKLPHPVLHRTPVGVWVEKTVHRLKPVRGRGEVRKLTAGTLQDQRPPVPTHRVGSSCMLKLPATFTTLRGFSGPP